jgi:hypothetical protein
VIVASYGVSRHADDVTISFLRGGSGGLNATVSITYSASSSGPTGGGLSAITTCRRRPPLPIRRLKKGLEIVHTHV